MLLIWARDRAKLTEFGLGGLPMRNPVEYLLRAGPWLITVFAMGALIPATLFFLVEVGGGLIATRARRRWARVLSWVLIASTFGWIAGYALFDFGSPSLLAIPPLLLWAASWLLTRVRFTEQRAQPRQLSPVAANVVAPWLVVAALAAAGFVAAVDQGSKDAAAAPTEGEPVTVVSTKDLGIRGQVCRRPGDGFRFSYPGFRQIWAEAGTVYLIAPGSPVLELTRSATIRFEFGAAASGCVPA